MTESTITPARSGVYRAPPDLAKLRAATGADAAWFDVDLTRTRDKASVLRTLAKALHFPPGFGENWDALADDLQDFSWRPARGYVLAMKAKPGTARASREDWRMLLDILEETSEYWKEHGKAFVVFVEGAEGLNPWQ